MTRLAVIVVTLVAASSSATAARDAVGVRLVSMSRFPAYPAIARAARVQGYFVLRLSLNSAGWIDQVETVSGHPMFHDEALQVLSSWHFEILAAKKPFKGGTFLITFHFKLRDAASENPTTDVCFTDFREITVTADPMPLETITAH